MADRLDRSVEGSAFAEDRVVNSRGKNLIDIRMDGFLYEQYPLLNRKPCNDHILW